jgi:hypothetical protein
MATATVRNAVDKAVEAMQAAVNGNTNPASDAD